MVIQFFSIEKTNPKVNEEHDMLTIAQAPANISSLIKRACYDCHSNETRYPWYAHVAPVSWWLRSHIDEGREHLNFSTWISYTPKKANHKFEECTEMLSEHEMPLKSYTLTHSEARLTEQEREDLVKWFKEMHQMPFDTSIPSGEEEAGEPESEIN